MDSAQRETNRRSSVDWSELIPEEEWSLYREVLERANDRGIRFAVGGGIAFSFYSQRCRWTKDLDLFILPGDRDRMVALLTECGFGDYHEREPYDREWIYRGYREGAILDLIWEMANHLSDTDEEWVCRGPEVNVRGVQFRLLPPEELVWAKLYVMQRERCDWPDLLNILASEAHCLNWDRLLRRAGEDARLLGGLLSVFAWLCPAEAATVPSPIWEQVGLLPPSDHAPADDGSFAPRLDTRDWFGSATGRRKRCRSER